MKLQIRTLSVQERKDLYIEALGVFSQPYEDRDGMDNSHLFADDLPEGVCEYLSGAFYCPRVFKGLDPYHVKVVAYSQHSPRIVELGKELMPELWHRKTKEDTEDEPYWFHNDKERLEALAQCIQDVSLLTEEDDEQTTKVLYEFEYEA